MTRNKELLSLLKRYLFDWFLLFVLIVCSGLVNLIHPFHRYVNEEILKSLMFPLKDNTIPSAIVPIIAFVFPLLILTSYSIFVRDKKHFHQSLLGLTYAIIYTSLIVDSLKVAIGRPRPNFFDRCFPNGLPVFQPNGDVLCSGNQSVINEGYKSFPSGHTSWSFSGLGYLSFHVAGKLHVFDQNGHLAKFFISFFPLVGATAIGITRIDDYWHNWTDVVTGGAIGLVIAYLCYRQHFPPLSHPECDKPWISITERNDLSDGNLRPQGDIETGQLPRPQAAAVPLSSLVQGPSDSDVPEIPTLKSRSSLPARSDSQGGSEVASTDLKQHRVLSYDSSFSSISEKRRLQPVADVLLGRGYSRYEKDLIQKTDSVKTESEE